MTSPHTSVAGLAQDRSDDAQLAALGYTPTFARDMSLWENFSLGFTYLSPVVGVYSIFALALAAGGPPMIFWLLIVGAGQFLVALVFAELVSQYPLAGGVYPWARRLWGRKWAWLTGWIYGWALLATIAAVSFGAGPFVADLLGIAQGSTVNILTAIGIILGVTWVNLRGTALLGRVAMFGFVCEILGALVLGLWLLVFDRAQPWSVIFDTQGLGHGVDGYLPAFLAAALIGLYQYYGFEACGDVAEEVADPGRRIPRAMRYTLYVGGAAATFICYALLLAVVDIPAVMSGADTDPIGHVLRTTFGPIGSRCLLGVVLVSFFSCALSLQAAASRLIYAYARDGIIAGSATLARVPAGRQMAPAALGLAAVLPVGVVLLEIIAPGGLVMFASFAALGIYVAFQMVVLAALRARIKGWRASGPYTLGRAGFIVNALALLFGVSAIVLLAQPGTSADAGLLQNWIVLIGVGVVVGTGLLYLALAGPHRRGHSPAGDALG